MDFSKGDRGRRMPPTEIPKISQQELKAPNRGIEPKRNSAHQAEIDKINREKKIKKNLDLLESKINTLTEWLTKEIFPIYHPYAEALKKPFIRRQISQTTKRLRDNFPKSLPDAEIIGILEPNLQKQFNELCSRQNTSPTLEIFKKRLVEFSKEKGLGQLSAYNIYDDLIKLHAVINQFKEGIKTNFLPKVK